MITDEITQDFDHACSVASKDFGMHWVELRAMWGKSLMVLDDTQLAEVEKTLAKYNLQVTDIGSPLFKAYWPGAPKSEFGPKNAPAGDVLKHEDEVLEKSVALAKRFKTNKVRCFDFWRIEDVAPYRAAIDAKLNEAAEQCGKQGVMLVLENEPACNTATGRESVRTLGAVKSQVSGVELGSGQCGDAWRVRCVSGGVEHVAEESNPSLPCEECSEGCGWQGGMVADRDGDYRLDGTVPRDGEGWVSRCGEPGDALARRSDIQKTRRSRAGRG